MTDLLRIVDVLVQELQEIDADERFHYSCATVEINAALALIQLEMEVRARMAQRILLLADYNGPEMGIKSGPRAGAR